MNPNSAQMIVLTGGATAEDVAAFALCCELFDGNDEEAVKAARARWASYKEAGHELTYFQQDDDGRWVKK
jgi:DNA polymerase-3 subunit chi